MQSSYKLKFYLWKVYTIQTINIRELEWLYINIRQNKLKAKTISRSKDISCRKGHIQQGKKKTLVNVIYNKEQNHKINETKDGRNEKTKIIQQLQRFQTPKELTKHLYIIENS